MIAAEQLTQLKSKVDLVDLAGRYTALRKEASQEWAGPCPKCHGHNRFRVRSDWFFCRQCHGDRGDAIEFLMWQEGLDFADAVTRLGANDLPHPLVRQKAERKRKPMNWEDGAWQDEARRIVDAGTFQLGSSAGEPGRAYLQARGLRPETWEVWGLGYKPDAWHPARRKTEPAILLPWQARGVIKAIQYRFIGPDIGKGERFSQKGGGDRTLYGTQLVNPKERGVLILVEGELNAVSIWQACHADGVDVASFGPQDNIKHAAPYMAKLAARYETVIVWADEPDRTHAGLEAIGRGGIALRSPGGEDANDLLRAGVLSDFIRMVLGQPTQPEKQAEPPGLWALFCEVAAEWERYARAGHEQAAGWWESIEDAYASLDEQGLRLLRGVMLSERTG